MDFVALCFKKKKEKENLEYPVSKLPSDTELEGTFFPFSWLCGLT